MRRTTLLVLVMLICGCSDREADDLNKKAEDFVSLERNNTDVSDDTWKDGRALRCEPIVKHICDHEECKKDEPRTWVIVRPSNGEYQRCDRAGCDTYQATVSHSGLWTTLSLPEQAAMLRLTSGGRAVEIAMQGDVAYVYHSQCRRID